MGSPRGNIAPVETVPGVSSRGIAKLLGGSEMPLSNGVISELDTSVDDDSPAIRNSINSTNTSSSSGDELEDKRSPSPVPADEIELHTKDFEESNPLFNDALVSQLLKKLQKQLAKDPEAASFFEPEARSLYHVIHEDIKARSFFYRDRMDAFKSHILEYSTTSLPVSMKAFLEMEEDLDDQSTLEFLPRHSAHYNPKKRTKIKNAEGEEIRSLPNQLQSLIKTSSISFDGFLNQCVIFMPNCVGYASESIPPKKLLTQLEQYYKERNKPHRIFLVLSEFDDIEKPYKVFSEEKGSAVVQQNWLREWESVCEAHFAKDPNKTEGFTRDKLATVTAKEGFSVITHNDWLQLKQNEFEKARQLYFTKFLPQPANQKKIIESVHEYLSRKVKKAKVTKSVSNNNLPNNLGNDSSPEGGLTPDRRSPTHSPQLSSTIPGSLPSSFSLPIAMPSVNSNANTINAGQNSSERSIFIAPPSSQPTDPFLKLIFEETKTALLSGAHHDEEINYRIARNYGRLIANDVQNPSQTQTSFNMFQSAQPTNNAGSSNSNENTRKNSK